MARVLKTLVVLATCGLFIPAAAYAQASITGLAKDTSGAVMPGVTVEASSPALIEKARSVVTDGSGQYRIVDLRPGTYVVTFALSGFSTVKREGIELSGSFTAVVNADMRVGTVAETLTVTSSAPLVDLQSAKKETVLTREVVDAIPSGRTANSMAVLIPGVVVTFGGFFVPGTQDVGGSRGADWTQVGIHGGRGDDMMTTINGNVTNDALTKVAQVNIAAYQEVTLETSGVSAEEAAGGIRTNLVPRDGGNAFTGSFFTTYGNDKLQADNLTADLKTQGLLATASQKKGYDLNPGFGGPLKRDKVWFFVSGRLLRLDNYAGGAVFNSNAGFTVNYPQSIVYAPAPSLGRAVANHQWTDLGAQVTWQAATKHKLSFGMRKRSSYDYNSFVGTVNTGALVSPEAGLDQDRPSMRTITADWTSPVSSRILLEAHFYDERFEGGFGYSASVNPQMPSVLDQGFGVRYDAFGPNSMSWNANDLKYRGSMTYVTGAHALKVGLQNGNGYNYLDQIERNPLTFVLNRGVPVSIVLDAGPLSNNVDKDAQLGIYAQDKWTLNSRLTLSGALRYDYYKASFPATPEGPGPLFPNRNITLPAGPNVAWKDLTYRSAAVFDVSGTGKTAVRVSLNRYVVSPTSTGAGNNGYGLSNGSAIVSTATRAWTNDANHNLFPDCVMTNFLANGECGPISDPNFGTIVPGNNVDPNVRSGFGVRPFDWEFSTGVQHQLAPRVSVDVGYYRRWYGNFTVGDNRAVSAADFDTFSIPVPTDSRLPNSGGTISGVVNLKPTSFGRPSQTVVTFTDAIGANQIEHWNGVDANVTARLSTLTLAMGTSTGRASTDNCQVIAVAPEATGSVLSGGGGGGAAGILTPGQFCHVDGKFLTQLKGYASYTVPHAAIQISASVQSVAGPPISATYVASNTVTFPSLGRLLSGGTTALNVQIIPPNQYYGDRLNQLDLRVAKIFRFRTLRLAPSVDVFNVTNGNAVLAENPNFGVFRAPVQINQGRLVKFSLNLTF
jgi:hypothetical protein